MQPEKMASHLEREHGQRKREPDPKPPLHVEKCGIGPVLGAGDQGLERHAADRASAGANPPDLRMHRAGVDRALGHGIGREMSSVIVRAVLVGGSGHGAKPCTS